MIRAKGAIDHCSLLIAYVLSREGPSLPALSPARFPVVLARQALLQEQGPEAALEALTA